MEGLISLPSYESVFAACDLLPRHGSYLWGSPPAAPLTEHAASQPPTQRAQRQPSAEAPAMQRSSSGGFSAGGFLAALASALANISMIAPTANGISEFTISSDQDSNGHSASSSRNSSGSLDAPAQAPSYTRRGCKRGVRRHVLARLPCRYLDAAAAKRAAERAASASASADSKCHASRQQEQQGRQGQLAGTQQEEGSEEDECALCMEPYSAAIVALPCKHEFCQACVQQWLSQHTNCPLCRWEFPPEQQRCTKRT